MKLAKILLEQGILTPDQLRSVVGLENLEDGQLGSCLLEEGLLSGDQLATALGGLWGVPPALDKDFARADPGLRKRLRAHQATSLKAIPLYVTQTRRIAVAMVDPGNPKNIDDLAFVLGGAIEAMVTSEPVLAQQLEVLYAMPRRRTTGFHPVAAADGAGTGESPILPEEAAGPRLDLMRLVADAEEELHTPPILPRRPARPHAPTQSYLAAVEDLPLFVPSAAGAPGQAVAEVQAQTPIPPMVSVTGPDMAVEQVLSSPDKQTAADNLFAFMRACFGAGAMFAVSGVFVQGRFGYNQGAPCPRVEGLVFSLSVPSSFHEAYQRGEVFHGAPGPEGEPVHRLLWQALGCEPPREVLVAPVITAGQIPILLYAQGRNNGRIEKFAAARMEHVCSALASTLMRLAG